MFNYPCWHWTALRGQFWGGGGQWTCRSSRSRTRSVPAGTCSQQLGTAVLCKSRLRPPSGRRGVSPESCPPRSMTHPRLPRLPTASCTCESHTSHWGEVTTQKREKGPVAQRTWIYHSQYLQYMSNHKVYNIPYNHIQNDTGFLHQQVHVHYFTWNASF